MMSGSEGEPRPDDDGGWTYRKTFIPPGAENASIIRPAKYSALVVAIDHCRETPWLTGSWQRSYHTTNRGPSPVSK